MGRAVAVSGEEDREDRNGLRSLIESILWRIDPEENPSAVVYGIVIVGSVIAVESAAHPSAIGETIATALVLVMYWLAHAYSEMVGERFEARAPLDWSHALTTVRHEAAIVRGASFPIVAMLIAALLGASATTTALAGIIVAVISLSLFSLLGGMRAHMAPWPLAAQALVGVVFGVLIGGVRALLG